jgi:phage protein U
MFAQFGSVAFELLPFCEDMESAREYSYPEHAVIEGKPKLQFTGTGLEKLTIKLVFHASFCVPETEMKKLRDLANQGQAQPLVFGSGVYKGRYVITAIKETTRWTDPQGRVIDLYATLSLKEFAGDSSAAVTGVAVSNGLTTVGDSKMPISAPAPAVDVVSPSTKTSLSGVLSGLGITSSNITGAINVISKASELGRLSQSEIIGALPSLIAGASNNGLSGVPGLASLASALQIAASSRLDTVGAISSVASFLSDLPNVVTPNPAASDPFDAAATQIRATVGTNLSQYATLFPNSDSQYFARTLTGSQPLYRSIQSISLAQADSVPADSSLFGVSLKSLLRVA